MNGRQKKKKFRKFILACEGYRKRARRENVEWRNDARRLRQSFWYGQNYSYPNRYRNKNVNRKYIKRYVDELLAKWAG